MNKFFAALVAAVLLALPATADGECYTTSSPEVDTGVVYVDNDPCQPNCAFSIWIYQESNGIAGLQRGDEVFSDVAGCNGDVEADTIVF